jgi:hypothetical protein
MGDAMNEVIVLLGVILIILGIFEATVEATMTCVKCKGEFTGGPTFAVLASLLHYPRCKGAPSGDNDSEASDN